MEGLEIYMKSYNNLTKMQKLCCANSVTINFDDFDSVTQGALRKAISETINVRKKEVYKVIANNPIS